MLGRHGGHHRASASGAGRATARSAGSLREARRGLARDHLPLLRRDRAARGPRAHRARRRARRHGVHARFQPRRMGLHGARRDGRGRRGRRHLHDELIERSRLYCRSCGIARLARRKRRAVAQDREGASEPPAPQARRAHARRDRHRAREGAHLGGLPRESRPRLRRASPRSHRLARGEGPRRLHLHVGHHGAAEGRDALARRAHVHRRFRPQHQRSRPRRLLALVPPALAHRGAGLHDPRADQLRERRLLRRVDREGRRQSQRDPTDALLRRPAHLGEVLRRHLGANVDRDGREEALSSNGRDASAKK